MSTEPDLNASTIDLLAATEGDPLMKFCCRQCGECSPKELLEEGKFPERISWLRKHYAEKHPGLWGKQQSLLQTMELTFTNLIRSSLTPEQLSLYPLDTLISLRRELGRAISVSPFDRDLRDAERRLLKAINLARQRVPAVIPTQPPPPSPKQELEFVSDSPEYLAFTIADLGLREPIDKAFTEAIERAKAG